MILLVVDKMNSLIAYLGYFYILVGTIFLLVPIIYLELGKPKDLINAFLNLLIGIILIIKNQTIDKSLFVIFLLSTLLFSLYLAEIFLSRWYQLTDKEKNRLTSFLEFKKNLSKILDAINLGMKNFTKPLSVFNVGSNNQNTNHKKWVRNDKNDNIKA